MSIEADKYSLWIVPDGEAGDQLQTAIDSLAETYDAPRFVPHITVVANIEAGLDDLAAEKVKIAHLAQLLGSFAVNVGSYGYTEEEYRYLYRYVDAPELFEVYAKAFQVFPQAAGEHFVAMPHLSMMYGTGQSLSSDQKTAIVRDLDAKALTFQATGLELYYTAGQPDEWQHVESFPFGTNNSTS